VRVLADGQTHTQTDANRFYNLSHAICYSYGTDNNVNAVIIVTGDRHLPRVVNISLTFFQALFSQIYTDCHTSQHTITTSSVNGTEQKIAIRTIWA